MDQQEWNESFVALRRSTEIIREWAPSHPAPTAARCEESRHRTLAHLRACQEQWLFIVREFLSRESPSVVVLHPWRTFDLENYCELPWDEHLSAFLIGRQEWLALERTADWTRAGKWNRKPDTVGGLAKRLASHEAYHIDLLKKRNLT